MKRLLTTLALASLSTLASAQEVRRERVLDDFVPDVDLLERVPASEIEELYSGVTYAGIYQVPFQEDQRFVESHGMDGVADYREGSVAIMGTWEVENRQLCFRYPDDGNRAHCWYVFRYGGCFVTYDRVNPMTGMPIFAREWGYIQKEVEEGFSWPERSVSEDDVFACEFAVS